MRNVKFIKEVASALSLLASLAILAGILLTIGAVNALQPLSGISSVPIAMYITAMAPGLLAVFVGLIGFGISLILVFLYEMGRDFAQLEQLVRANSTSSMASSNAGKYVPDNEAATDQQGRDSNFIKSYKGYSIVRDNNRVRVGNTKFPHVLAAERWINEEHAKMN